MRRAPTAGLRGPAAVGLLGIAALALLAARDPETEGPYPPCLSATLLGVECPLCGGLRGVHDLMHGNVMAMLDHNALLPLYLVFLVATFSGWTASRLGYRVRVHPKVITTAMGATLIISVLFGVLRNFLPSLAASAG